MHSFILNITLAFFEGFALIVSPCILPVLPIILSSSLTGSKARPLGIISGFVLSFSVVTLFSKKLVEVLHVNPDVIRNGSLILLTLFGIVMLSSWLTEKFNILTQRLTSVGSSVKTINNPEGGFAGGLLFGMLIGIVWTPCAGPILAAVIVQVVLQETTIASIMTVIAFAIGAGVPMLMIALLGRKLMDKFAFFRNKTGVFRQLLGFIIVISVIIIYFEASTANLVSKKISAGPSPTGMTLIDGLSESYPAPAIEGIDAWINSVPLTLSALRGKVVLLDIWTYSCINCLRTLPYIKEWYSKYHDKGLEIIGIHCPEFEFEHDLGNVTNAVKRLGITYPVALDNQFVTWRALGNLFWPAHYLIDKEGRIVYTSVGEGKYDITENNIRYLLGLSRAENVVSDKVEKISAEQSPETYFGYARMANYASPERVAYDSVADYTYPTDLQQHQWALKGKWMVHAEDIVSNASGASIKFHFNSKNVYAVMGVSGAPVSVKVYLNGQPLIASKELNSNQLVVDRHQLYPVVTLQKASDGVVELVADNPGLELYTFTFGD